MGSSWSGGDVEDDWVGEFHEMKRQIRVLNDRLAVVEKNYPNVLVRVNETARIADRNRDEILNIRLLEEGRSTYRPRKTHIHSTYM